MSVADHADVALLDPNSSVAKALDLIVVVGNDEHGNAMLFNEPGDSLFAFLLAHEVANGENFVADVAMYRACPLGWL